MRVLFIVTGVGLGDSTRAHAIINQLLKKDPKTEIMVAGYDNSYAYFHNKFNTIKIRGYRFNFRSMEFKAIPFLLKDLSLPLTWLDTIFLLRKKVKRFNPDIIISGFEPAGIALAKLIKKKCFIIFGYDPEVFDKFNGKNTILRLEANYFEKIYSEADKVIISSFSEKKKSNHYCYVNPIVLNQPKKINKNKVMRRLGLKKEPIVVTIGGSKFGQSLCKKIVNEAKYINEEFIIFGNLAPLSSGNVRVMGLKYDITDYLAAAKGVITLSGNLTISECLAYKKPMLLFPIKNHVEQMLNAYMMRNIAMVSYGTENIKNKIVQFINNLGSLKKKIPKLRFNGAEQVVDLISSQK